jgi:uncharacterized protein
MRLNLATTRKTLAAALLPFAALGAAGWNYLDHKQRELIFRPESDQASGLSVDLSFEEMWLPLARAGAEAALHAWWLPAAAVDAPTILFLHGARWSLFGNANRIAYWHSLGYSLLAIDYRGFGKSPGELPTEASVYEDAQSAWEHLKRFQPDAKRRLIYGHSLGGAIGIDLAAKNGGDFAGLIVESTFTNIRDMAKIVASRWLPLGPAITQRFDSIAKIGSIQAPILLMHGTADEVVPHEMSLRLHQAARDPKHLAMFTDAAHGDACWKADGDYRKAVREFIGAAVA